MFTLHKLSINKRATVVTFTYAFTANLSTLLYKTAFIKWYYTTLFNNIRQIIPLWEKISKVFIF